MSYDHKGPDMVSYNSQEYNSNQVPPISGPKYDQINSDTALKSKITLSDYTSRKSCLRTLGDTSGSNVSLPANVCSPW